MNYGTDVTPAPAVLAEPFADEFAWVADAEVSEFGRKLGQLFPGKRIPSVLLTRHYPPDVLTVENPPRSGDARSAVWLDAFSQQ